MATTVEEIHSGGGTAQASYDSVATSASVANTVKIAEGTCGPVDYGSSGGTANCLAPGATTRLSQLTVPMFEQQHRDGNITDEMWEAIKAGPGPAIHVAPVVAWLCSDAAAAVDRAGLHGDRRTRRRLVVL